MRISSNSYDYYKMLYSLNTQSSNALNINTLTDSDSQSNTTSTETKKTAGINASLMGLNIQGMMMRDKMDKLENDMDSIKTADIDSMTSDEVKETLSKLKSNMEAMPLPPGAQSNTNEIDLESMSETDMRNKLKEIQAHANNAPEMPKGMPPRMEGTEGIQGASSTDTDTQSTLDTMLQQIIEKLTESFDSSTGDSEEYADDLKESLNSMFNRQGSTFSQLQAMLFDKLDQWSTQDAKISTTEEI